MQSEHDKFRDNMVLWRGVEDNGGSGTVPDFSLEVVAVQEQIKIHELTAKLLSEFRRAGYRENTIWRKLYAGHMHV